ncbi:MAG: nitronate monooxygenase [Phycisphaerae bacterium]|nr:nitronate monooxygenase [Phycisphaerae bacterium]
MESSYTQTFFERGREFLQVDTPIICGAMTWVSDPQLVSAVANAGAFALLAGGNTPVDILERQIKETQELTDKPFGINLITIAPLYKDHLELVRKHNLPFVVFAGSFPRKTEVLKAKATGAKVLCFASTMSIANRMLSYGADALILEGMEAGGHVGHVSLMILLQQVLFKIRDVPIFVAGGIGTGQMCAHLFLMGAAGVQLGTAFAVSDECTAHPNFKKRFIQAKAREAISTPEFDSRLHVVAVRALRNKGYEDFNALQLELMEALDNGTLAQADVQMRVEEFWMGKLRSAVIDGDIEHGSLMAGQSVGLIHEMKPVKAIIQDLLTDMEAEFSRVAKQLKA